MADKFDLIVVGPGSAASLPFAQASLTENSDR